MKSLLSTSPPSDSHNHWCSWSSTWTAETWSCSWSLMMSRCSPRTLCQELARKTGTIGHLVAAPLPSVASSDHGSSPCAQGSPWSSSRTLCRLCQGLCRAVLAPVAASLPAVVSCNHGSSPCAQGSTKSPSSSFSACGLCAHKGYMERPKMFKKCNIIEPQIGCSVLSAWILTCGYYMWFWRLILILTLDSDIKDWLNHIHDAVYAISSIITNPNPFFYIVSCLLCVCPPCSSGSSLHRQHISN